MINRFFIISLIFFTSKAGFTKNGQTGPMTPSGIVTAQKNSKTFDPQSYVSNLKKKIPKMNINKERDLLDSAEKLKKHAYSTLFTMNAYHTHSIKAAYVAASAVSDHSASAVSDHAALDAASHAVKLAASYVAEKNSLRSAKEEAWVAFRNHHGIWYNAMNAAKLAIKELPKSNDLEVNGEIAYEAAKKVVLNNFITDDDDDDDDNDDNNIIKASYDASMYKIYEVHPKSIFNDQTKWDKFKLKFFGEIEQNNQEAYKLLKPWIEELDWTVKEIEKFNASDLKKIPSQSSGIMGNRSNFCTIPQVEETNTNSLSRSNYSIISCFLKYVSELNLTK